MSARLIRAWVVALALGGAGAGCHRAPEPEGRLPERAYLWQRDWTPAVVEGFREAERRMDGVVILGAEVGWSGGTAHVERATIDWDELRGKTVGLAVRMGIYGGPFAENEGPARTIKAEAGRLLDEARAHNARAGEMQLDFDCADRKLAGYGVWVRALKRMVEPVPLVITALPSWLEQPAFPALAREADGYVLQVHSVPTLAESGRAELCDAALARKWVERASEMGLPFSVSLPAYWCVGGYDGQGRLLGVAMDSVQPAWPAGTSMLEFSADADGIAGLVSGWTRDRPAGMKGLLWYRAPVATDQRNWRWPTLAAVMAGRKPEHRVEVMCDGDNPVDVSIGNRGEAEEREGRIVTLTWSGAEATAADALPGWTVSIGKDRAVFKSNLEVRFRLSPGERRSIGWIRYDKKIVPVRDVRVEDGGVQ